MSDVKDCTCSRCWREFTEAEMDAVTELCRGCAAEVAGARVVVIVDEVDEQWKTWSEERRVVEAWLLARGL